MAESFTGQETLLRNLEHFLRLSRQRGWKVLPLVLVPKLDELAGRLPDYYFLALDLLKYYGLDVVDVSAEFRRRLGRVPESYYNDPAHYRRCDEVTGEIGRMVRNALDKARRPLDVSARRGEARRGEYRVDPDGQIVNLSELHHDGPASGNADKDRDGRLRCHQVRHRSV